MSKWENDDDKSNVTALSAMSGKWEVKKLLQFRESDFILIFCFSFFLVKIAEHRSQTYQHAILQII